MRGRGVLAAMLLACAGVLTVSGQDPAASQPVAAADSVVRPTGRVAKVATVTPVEVDTEKPAGPVWHKYDIHGKQLKTPVLFLAETDTVKRASAASPWPVYNGVDVALNFIDGPLMIAGQRYAGYDVRAAVSLYNWVFPTVEFGLGYVRPGEGVKYTPSVAPYYRAGFDYNFLYKSKPDYRAFVGFRAAYTPWRYNMEAQPSSKKDEPTQVRANHYYGQVLFGIKVKAYKALFMGWELRYSFRIHMKDFEPTSDWYVPGYGGSPISGAFVAGVTF